jgi:tRNA(Arg) A34 adenosine deaminase TadA
MHRSDEPFLRQAIEISWRSRRNGNHPFGALLVDAAGKVILEAENTVMVAHDCTGHAELNLMRDASQRFSRGLLAGCTLYTSTEPCAMCSGAIYWGNVGRVVYALSEAHLKDYIGDDPENPTLALPCREVFARGQRLIEVLGPALEEEAGAAHKGFWHPG